MAHIDYLLLIECTHICTTLDEMLRVTLGNTQFSSIMKAVCDNTKRIVLLLDGYDRLSRAAEYNLLGGWINAPLHMRIIATTRGHKTNDLTRMHVTKWVGVRCNGVAQKSDDNNQKVTPLEGSYI
jgi:hypothetical protein